MTLLEGSVNVGLSWQVVKICDISGSGLVVVGCWVDLQSWEEVTSAHATNLSLQRPKLVAPQCHTGRKIQKSKSEPENTQH